MLGEEIVCEDRISALHDDLLITILRSIPIEDAVATMVLSKRWRFLWTMLSKLIYKESHDESKKSVWWFLDKSMELHKAPVLPNLHMKLGPRCPTDADVGKWIAKTVDRGLRLLWFELLWSADPTSLPITLYSCKSLQILILYHKILVDVPSSACLPSLLTLSLFKVVYKDDDSLVKLLSSCPILECLFVTRAKGDNMNICTLKAPRLLDLTYSNYDYYVEDSTRCLVIDTPALKELDILDYSGDSCYIENTPHLEQVCIRVYCSFPDINKIFRSFSTVLFLELVLTEKVIMCYSTIKFSRLTKCKIIPRDSDWMDTLVSFLQNTPKLEYLVVDYNYTDQPPMASNSWSESSLDPECLSSSLVKFELIEYGGREEEQKLVEYILTTSKCLKTATISFRSTFLEEDKDTMVMKLKAIPRVSIASQLLFKNLTHAACDMHT